ncbi:MAG TPA: type II secretion system protein [Candidatus Magasanikbacteria bacterium]|nr:type II secretion system protein [Candidatus Magasanikbacteria bacterium]
MFKKGFTLIEILLVVAAIAILAGIVILAINPTKQLGETRNARRRADVTTILNAVYQYAIDHNGTIPSSINTIEREICKYNYGDCTGYVDLSVVAADAKYVVDWPMDPSGIASGGIGYNIYRDTNNRVIVTAPHAEQNATISVSR